MPVSLVDTIKGVSERVEINPEADYTLPADLEQVTIGDVTYEFGGWYTTPDCSGSPVTVILANTYNTNNSKFYSKWTPVVGEEN